MISRNTKKIFAALYSASNGVSAAASIGYSVQDTSGNLASSVTTAGIGLLAETYTSWNFQGQSIIHADDEEVDVDLEDQSSSESQKNRSTIFMQLMYCLLASSRTLAERYFLFNYLFYLLSLENEPLFLSLLFLDTFVKILFDGSNEMYENNEMIAMKMMGEKSPPFYINLFKPISGPTARTVFNVAGTLEHTVGDDLLPWMTFLTEDAIKYLQEHEDIRTLVISLAATIGFALAALVFIQTYYFEGKHTEHHLAKLHDKSKRSAESEAIFSYSVGTALQASMNLMGPLHAASKAAPVFVMLRKMLKNNYTPAILSAIVGVINSVGTHLSEVTEAKEMIKGLTKEKQHTLQFRLPTPVFRTESHTINAHQSQPVTSYQALNNS